MTVYIDAIWLLNFGFDTLLLLWTTLLLKQSLIWWRLLLAGGIGSSTVFLYLTPYAFLMDLVPVKIAISLAMLLIAIRWSHWRSFFQGLLAFYLLTFLAGGTLFGLHFLSQSGTSEALQSTDSSDLYGEPTSWLFVILAFPLTYLLTKLYTRGIKAIRVRHQQQVQAFCQINGIELAFEGLVDTGNALVDPISRLPIVVVSITKMRDQFPASVLKVVDEGVGASGTLPSEWQQRARLVPYKVIGHQSNILLAFKPDAFSIENTPQKCLVSFSKEPLTSGAIFQAIIHPDLLPEAV